MKTRNFTTLCLKQLHYKKDFRLLPKSPVTHLLSKAVTTQTVSLIYLESAMFDNLVLHGSDQPGQKETCCIPLMKASSQRNLDLKKNMLVVIQPFSEHAMLTKF